MDEMDTIELVEFMDGLSETEQAEYKNRRGRKYEDE